MLHPDFDTLSEEQELDLQDDKIFIIENTDAIHEKFEEFGNSNSPRYMKESSEQEKLQRAIEENKNEKNIKTPAEVVKVALGTATECLADKIIETEDVPVKEGEIKE